jgi:hypothetical protein
MQTSQSVLEGVDYEPLLASWPETDIDQQLLDNAPPAARYILRRAYRDFKTGYLEDEKLWDEWLALLEAFGPDDEGVRIGLLGLTFLRHEARHHLDFYSTPLGWVYPSLVAGYYFRLSQLTRLNSASPEAQELIRRLVRFRRVQDVLAGNVPRVSKNLWHENPISEKITKLGIFRYRHDKADPQIAIATLQPLGGLERAISVNSILEARAIIETSGYMAGRLRAAGASQPKIISAVELLLRLTVQIARDDYWGLLNIGLAAVDLKDAAVKLIEKGPPCGRLMIATWFALHVENFKKDIDVLLCSPPLRLTCALNEFFKFTDSELKRPNLNWPDILDQLAKLIGGIRLIEAEAYYVSNLEDLEVTLHDGTHFSGLAQEHISYLLGVARQGLALRSRPLDWADKVGWPEQEDPRTIVNWGTAPKNVRTAWSRLTRFQNLLRTNSAVSVIIDTAKSLF